MPGRAGWGSGLPHAAARTDAAFPHSPEPLALLISFVFPGKAEDAGEGHRYERGFRKCGEEGRETVDYCTLHPKTLPLAGHSVVARCPTGLAGTSMIGFNSECLSCPHRLREGPWHLDSMWEGCLWLCSCGDGGQVREHSFPPQNGALDAPWCFQVGLGLGHR